jgi:hypothetical protein
VNPPLRLLLRVGIGAMLVGAIALGGTISHYIAHPYALDSLSPFLIFQKGVGFIDNPAYAYDYVQYAPFVLGIEPILIVVGASLVLVVALMQASWWRPRSRSER